MFGEVYSFESRVVSSQNYSLLTVSFVIALLVGVGLMNLGIDPYAQYGTGFVRPVVQESRLTKLRLFEELPDGPQGVVLGSSRVHKFDPEVLQINTGNRFFNFGVNHGRPEDFLALYRHLRKQSSTVPSMLLIGVDPISLSDAEEVDARLLGINELSGQIREYLTWEDRAKRWSDLLSWNQTKNSLHALKSLARHTESPAEESFREDGLIQYHRREVEIANGEYDFEAALSYNIDEYTTYYRRVTGLSEARCDCLREVISTARSEGTEVVLFLPTLHPRLLESLNQIEGAEPFRERCRGFLEQLAQTNAIPLYDFTELTSFNGQAAQFVDGIHPLEPNTKKMIDIMFPLTVEDRYALQ